MTLAIKEVKRQDKQKNWTENNEHYVRPKLNVYLFY